DVSASSKIQVAIDGVIEEQGLVAQQATLDTQINFMDAKGQSFFQQLLEASASSQEAAGTLGGEAVSSVALPKEQGATGAKTPPEHGEPVPEGLLSEDQLGHLRQIKAEIVNWHRETDRAEMNCLRGERNALRDSLARADRVMYQGRATGEWKLRPDAPPLDYEAEIKHLRERVDQGYKARESKENLVDHYCQYLRKIHQDLLRVSYGRKVDAGKVKVLQKDLAALQLRYDRETKALRRDLAKSEGRRKTERGSAAILLAKTRKAKGLDGPTSQVQKDLDQAEREVERLTAVEAELKGRLKESETALVASQNEAKELRRQTEAQTQEVSVVRERMRELVEMQAAHAEMNRVASARRSAREVAEREDKESLARIMKEVESLAADFQQAVAEAEREKGLRTQVEGELKVAKAEIQRLVEAEADAEARREQEREAEESESDEPPVVFDASTVSQGGEIHVMGGVHSTHKVQVYNTETGLWRHLVAPPSSFQRGTPSVVMETESETDSEGEDSEPSEVQRERTQREEAERTALCAMCVPLGVDIDDHHCCSLGDVVLPHLATRVTSLEADLAGLKSSEQDDSNLAIAAVETRLSSLEALSDAFCAFSDDNLSDIRSLIERVTAFDIPSLHSSIEEFQKYLSVSQKYDKASLDQFFDDHPLTELVSADCDEVSRRLLPLNYQIIKQMNFTRTFEEGLPKVLRDALELCSDVMRVRLIPLPQNTTILSFPDQQKYFKAEGYNTEVRTLFSVASVLLDSHSVLEEYEEAHRAAPQKAKDLLHLIRRARTLRERLSSLSARHTEATALLHEYQSLFVEAETELAVTEASIASGTKQLQHLRNSGKRSRKLKELASLRTKLMGLQKQVEQRDSIRERLTHHLIFPEVAAALGLPQQPLEPEEE
ncbi:hypothetical protein KIPB_000234, partial [Kipferlia bialata]